MDTFANVNLDLKSNFTEVLASFVSEFNCMSDTMKIGTVVTIVGRDVKESFGVTRHVGKVCFPLEHMFFFFIHRNVSCFSSKWTQAQKISCSFIILLGRAAGSDCKIPWRNWDIQHGFKLVAGKQTKK